jgi:hypothetical protein
VFKLLLLGISSIVPDGLITRLPDDSLAVYYELFRDGVSFPSRLAFSDDTEDEMIGRIPTRAIEPPHTVATLKRVILGMEGIAFATSSVDIYAGSSDDSLELLGDCVAFQSDEMWTGVKGRASLHHPLSIVVAPGKDGCASPTMSKERNKSDKIVADNERPIGWISAFSISCKCFTLKLV